ncbi:MAG: hypothetical protein V3V32_03220 [Dehalococcoidia bacterium]
MEFRNVIKYLKGAKEGHTESGYIAIPVTTAYNICVWNLPRCCGAAVVGSFQSGALGPTGRAKLTEVIKALKVALVKEQTSILIATTSKSQSGAAKVLAKTGFKEVHTTHNPKSGGIFTLWQCILSKKNARTMSDAEEPEDNDGENWYGGR